MILQGFRWKACLIYICDAIVFSPNAEVHLTNVDETLQVLENTRLSLKFDKCISFTNTVGYLGHMIKPGRLQADETEVKALNRAEPLRTVADLRLFLTFFNVCKRFLENFTRFAKREHNHSEQKSTTSYLLSFSRILVEDCAIRSVQTPSTTSSSILRRNNRLFSSVSPTSALIWFRNNSA